jgi:hypothetical protein
VIGWITEAVEPITVSGDKIASDRLTCVGVVAATSFAVIPSVASNTSTSVLVATDGWTNSAADCTVETIGMIASALDTVVVTLFAAVLVNVPTDGEITICGVGATLMAVADTVVVIIGINTPVVGEMLVEVTPSVAKVGGVTLIDVLGVTFVAARASVDNGGVTASALDT